MVHMLVCIRKVIKVNSINASLSKNLWKIIKSIKNLILLHTAVQIGEAICT